MLGRARDLASSHGYTVLQAIQEWHSSKGSSKAMRLPAIFRWCLANLGSLRRKRKETVLGLDGERVFSP